MDFIRVQDLLCSNMRPCIRSIGGRHCDCVLRQSYTYFSTDECLNEFQMFNDPSELARDPRMVRAVGVRMGGTALVDTVISIAMTYYVSLLVRNISKVD